MHVDIGEFGLVPMKAMDLGRTDPWYYGFQCHFEVIEADCETWVNMLEDEFIHLMNTEQVATLRATRAEFQIRLPAAQAFGRDVTRRWLDLAQVRRPRLERMQAVS